MSPQPRAARALSPCPWPELPAPRGSTGMGRLGSPLSIHYQLMQWNWLTMGSEAAKIQHEGCRCPWDRQTLLEDPCGMKGYPQFASDAARTDRQPSLEEGPPSERKINPVLSPDCYCLLWFKLSDSGHFLYVAICLLPEGIAERKKEKVNLARRQGRSRVFSRQLTELTSGSP